MYRYRTIPNQRPVQQTGTVVVAFSFSFFSSCARISGECSTIHSPPALRFFIFKWRLAFAH